MTNKKHKPSLSFSDAAMGLLSAGALTGMLAWTPIIKPALTEIDQSITEATSRPIAPEPYCTLSVNKYTSRVEIYAREKEADGAHRLHQTTEPLKLENDKSVRLAPGLTGVFVAQNNRTHVYNTGGLVGGEEALPVMGSYSSNEGIRLVITGWKKDGGVDVPVGSCGKTGINIKGTVWETMPLQAPPIQTLG